MEWNSGSKVKEDKNNVYNIINFEKMPNKNINQY